VRVEVVLFALVVDGVALEDDVLRIRRPPVARLEDGVVDAVFLDAVVDYDGSIATRPAANATASRHRPRVPNA
jgi:hypothetical protein